MKIIERLKDYYGKKKPELTMGLAAAAVVFIVYLVFNLIIWNAVNISYAIIFALVAFVLFFVFQRLLKYIITEKEGVIEKHK